MRISVMVDGLLPLLGIRLLCGTVCAAIQIRSHLNN